MPRNVTLSWVYFDVPTFISVICADVTYDLIYKCREVEK